MIGAGWCGTRVLGAVLPGSLDDGAAGLAAIAADGGTALVQNLRDAMAAGTYRAEAERAGRGKGAAGTREPVG